MTKKSFFVSVVCFCVLSSCQFPWTKKAEIVPPAVDSLSTAFEDSLKLDTDYIAHFRLDGFTAVGQENKYLGTKKKLVDAYNAGDRSLNLLRAYIYLTGLE